MTSTSLLLSQMPGRVKKASAWPQVTSRPVSPSSFPDSTLPDNPQAELGKNLQRHPRGGQLEGCSSDVVMR